MSDGRLWWFLSGCFGGLGVGLGAFGAHVLRAVLDEPAKAVYQTAVQYQFIHALALGLLALWAGAHPQADTRWAGGAFTGGILFFSGSLYLLALTGVRAWGAVTPVGGVLFLLGWIAFAFLARKA